ncbi:MAG: A24 family peptidase [Clostridiaceae bacterium]|nr:A24 family peptidase [Clostridiaceae bacterium]
MREIFLLLLLGGAVCRDVREQKISNKLIAAGWMAAVIFRFVSEGFLGVLGGAAAVILTIALFFPFFCCKGIGAGDIKLWSVIAGLYGVYFLFEVLAVLFVLAGIYALMRILREWFLRQRFRYAGGEPALGRGLQGSRMTGKKGRFIILAPFTLMGVILVFLERWGQIC